ncbi:MAG: hypothetical protein DRN53_03720 [Thermoprotei archaeon]|nr:MAG: hypothetical protein DRN53_03720 [Thermoprotei archaeon]
MERCMEDSCYRKGGIRTIDLAESIENSIELPLTIIGLGNELKGDDGVGVYIARKLRSLGHSSIIVAGISIENHVYRVLEFDPRTVILIDAIEAGLEPGSIVLGDVKNVVHEFVPITTHTIPLPLIIRIVERELGHSVKWLLLGIQVGSTTIGEPISEDVKESADIVIKILHGILKKLFSNS